jgi:hypothetical protein
VSTVLIGDWFFSDSHVFEVGLVYKILNQPSLFTADDMCHLYYYASFGHRNWTVLELSFPNVKAWLPYWTFTSHEKNLISLVSPVSFVQNTFKPDLWHVKVVVCLILEYFISVIQTQGC